MTVTVLLSGAGGAGSIAIIRALRETRRYKIVAVDASPYAYGMALADEGSVVPLATAPDFEAKLETILEKQRPNYLVPLVDEEIPVFHKIAGRFNSKVLAPSPAFCAMALDKWLTYQALTAAHLPAPQSWLASDAGAVEYPAIIKPRVGRGSRGLACLNKPHNLEDYLSRAGTSAHQYIVQRRLRGQEFTVSAVVGLGGPTLAVVPKEVIIKRGITQVGVTRAVPAIDRLCREIQDRLRADGPFNLQLMLSQDGTPHVFEINPRYSTTVALTIAAGINEVDVVIRHDEGEPIGPLAFQENLLMIRYPTQFYVPESEWLPARVGQRWAGQVAHD